MLHRRRAHVMQLKGGIGSLKVKSAVRGNLEGRGRLVQQLQIGLETGAEPCRDGEWQASCLKLFLLFLSTRKRELQYAISETYQQATAE
jgi:hypothetical protein